MQRPPLIIRLRQCLDFNWQTKFGSDILRIKMGTIDSQYAQDWKCRYYFHAMVTHHAFNTLLQH